MTDLHKETDILELLKNPIQEECYMIALAWWNQWNAYIAAGAKNGLEPGIIYNLDLV